MMFCVRESSSGQVFQEEQAPSTLGNQEQDDDFDFWTESYASDDDEIPTKQVSQDIMEEVSLTIDEVKIRKMADEMLRQRCTSGDEHQYHTDQMKNFLKSDIVWESRNEILVSPPPQKTIPLVHSCQKDHEAPALSLINQDILYLKKGNSGPEKIVLSLHKFPAIIFNNDDIEERTFIWVNKCVNKFNPYARYGVDHWKHPHAKIFYIRKQKEPGKSKEEIYSNSKVVQLIWERVHDFQLGIESYQQKVNLTAPTMTFPGIEDHEMFSIIYEPVHGIIYKNSKKEKRVMRHSEIHKFCDATLNRVLEGLKSYNNDVKYGYVQKDLTKDETEYLKLFEEEIEERLKHRRQMRRWEMVIISSQIQNAIDNAIPSLVDASVRSYMSGHILHVHPAQVQSSSVPEQQHQLYLAMKADPLLQQQDIAIWLALQMKFEKTQVPQTACRSSAVRTRDQDDPHDDAHPEGENSAKRQKTSEYEAYVSGESSSGQVNVEEPGPSTSGNQEQDDEFDFWTDSYASDDDEILTKQVTQDIMEEISLTIDEAKLKKMVDEMLRQRCTSGDEHQYHIDQMKNFLQSDIVWESRKEILVSPHPRKITPLVQSCQRDPEAPALSLINQDLLYLKKGNSGPEKIVLSLHKFPAIVFNDDDIEERTSRWVNKCIKKFNPYARYGVENWKNPHAKIFYIRRQKEPGRPKEEIYSNSKIVQVIKTYWELGHEHKFITEIVARRANDCIVSITEPDYKNLNKNDIEDMYLLIVNNKVPDYANTGLLWSLSVFIRSSVIWERVHDFQLGIESYQQKINLTAPTITFPGIEEYDVFSIVYEPVHGIIYTNSKKEKRVMRHSEIHKFCDATLRRTLEGLKSYYNDVKYGYVQKELTNDEVEFLKLFEEEIEVRLNYRDQMRRWEMYVNGRPLGPRRERPE
ncbi:hypothetical protein Tco_1164484 [Tanacetum coccineum]